MISIGEKKWFVVYTKPRWEKKIANTLTEMGIENYCPLNKVSKQWTDRKKNILEPLFKGYLFVAPEETAKWDLKLVDGILNFVYWLGKPAVVRSEEIITIKKFLNEFKDVEVIDLNTVVNETVTIKQGVFMDYKGIVLEIVGNKAKVKIESMSMQLTATFEIKNLEKISGDNN